MKGLRSIIAIFIALFIIAIIAFIITYTIFVVTYPPSAEEALIYIPIYLCFLLSACSS